MQPKPRLNAITLAIALTLATATQADEKNLSKKTRAGKNADPSTASILSKKGRARIEENLRRLDVNLANLRSNVRTTQRNLKIIENEIEKLRKLEMRFVEIEKQLKPHLQKELNPDAENKQRIAQLKTKKKQLTDTAVTQSPQVKRTLDALNKELEERDLWQKKAASSDRQLRRAFRKATDTLSRIRARLTPLETALTTWRDQSERFSDLERSFLAWKREYESLLKEQTKVRKNGLTPKKTEDSPKKP